MSRVPRVSGSELIKILERLGYIQMRTVGSHVRLRHPHRPPTTVPLHDVIGPGLLRKIMRDTGLTLSDLFTD
jgi:predicted RNA binding protein YcfA (HicA-like mRNA interferase family)